MNPEIAMSELLKFGRKYSFQSFVVLVLIILFTAFQNGVPANSLSVGTINETLQTTGGGGGNSTADCATSNSNTIIYEVVGDYVTFDGPTLTNVYGNCATIQNNGFYINAYTHSIGPFGGNIQASTRVAANCYNVSPTAAYTMVGARVYKTPGGFVAGLRVYCGLLPSGNSSFLLSTLVAEQLWLN